MRTTAFALASLILAAGVATAQKKSGDEAALLAIEQKWDEASMKGDTAALEALWADGIVSTGPDGKVRTKREMVSRIKSGAIKFQASKVDDVKVTVYGDAAIVTGKWTGKYVENGKPTAATERFTDTFVRQGGQWRCVASHTSPIK